MPKVSTSYKPGQSGNPLGKPRTTLDQLGDYRNILVTAGNEGATEAEWRLRLGISTTLWYALMEREPDFKAAVEEARDASYVWFNNVGREMMIGNMPGCQASLWMFRARVHYGMNDKTQLELSGPNGGAIQTETKLNVSGLSTETLRELASVRIDRS